MSDNSTAPPVASSSSRSLDRSLASGLAWSGLAKWGVQVLSWISTLIVARLLTPSDYGIVGMAAVYIGLVQMVSEFGLGTAIIQQQQLDRSQIACIGGFSALLGGGLFAASIALAEPIARFFGEPAVKLVLIVLASNFVTTSFQILPYSLLSRELRFRRIAAIEGTEALVQTVVTLGLAVAGARYWAIVIGILTAKVTSTALLVASRPHRLQWPLPLRQVRGALGFGGQVVVTRLSWYAYSNADFAVVGRLLGKVALGAYTIGWNLASMPADKITGVLARVTLPVFAAVQRDKAAVARYLLVLSEGLALVVLPASIGLVIVAPDFVRVVLGERWLAAIVPLQLLSAHVTFRALNPLFTQTLMALGDTRQPMRVSLVQVVVLPALFIVAAERWGVNGVALAWLVGHPLLTVPLIIWYTLRRIDLDASTYLRALWPAVSSTALMAVAALLVEDLLATAPGAQRLAVTVATGAAVYAGGGVLFHRKRLKALLSGLRELRR